MGLVAFGLAPILVRFAQDTPAIVLVTYRTVFAAALLLPTWLWKRRSRSGPPTDNDAGDDEPAKGSALYLAIAGICLGLHFTFWVASLYYTSVASASVLVTIHPIIFITVEWLWFKRSYAATTWIGVLLALAGSVLLGVSDSQIEQPFADPLFGNMLAFAAAVIFVAYLFIGQKMRQQRSWINYVFPVYSYAALTCVLLAFILGYSLTDISATGVWVGLGLAVGPQILGHGSMNYAVKFVSPTLISTLVLSEPLFASVLAFFIFSELPPLASLLAMGIILAGVGLTWKRKADPGAS